jgi:hypothetical protein
MQVPSILQGESLTRILQGAAIGAIATVTIGFYWGGWVTAGGMREMVHKSTTSAIVAALAPICVDNFQRSADASANLVEFKKVKLWQQDTFVKEHGWATMPGTASPDSAVARGCAEMLNNLKP